MYRGAESTVKANRVFVVVLDAGREGMGGRSPPESGQLRGVVVVGVSLGRLLEICGPGVLILRLYKDSRSSSAATEPATTTLVEATLSQLV
jgi:hypothetical protein